jgi:hypothetical protein
LVLVDPRSPIRPPELARARSAAHRFAVSFLLAGATRGRAAIQSAVPSLAREVNAIAARKVPQLPVSGARLDALAVFPLGRGRIEARITIAVAGGVSYPITYFLQNRTGRWLVAELPGG